MNKIVCLVPTVVILLMKYSSHIIEAQTPQAIGNTTVINLILVKTYGELVDGFKLDILPFEREYRKRFNAQWLTTLSKNKKREIFQQLVKHWVYTENLAGRPEVSVTELLVVLRTKTIAFSRGINFMICYLYYAKVENFKANSCQNLALYTIIFGQLGADELARKMVDHFVHSLTISGSYLGEVVEMAQDMKKFISQIVQKGINSNSQNKRDPKPNCIIKNLVKYAEVAEDVSRVVRFPRTIDDMFNNIMFTKEQFTLKDNIDYLWSVQRATHLWNKAVCINEKVRLKCQQFEFNIVELISDILIEDAVTRGVSREIIEDVFKIMKPKSFWIREYNGNFVHNIQIIGSTLPQYTSDYYEYQSHQGSNSVEN